MNVRAPFTGARIRLPRSECVLEVEKHRETPVFLLQRLREVDGLSVAMQYVNGFFVDLRDVNGCSLLQLEDRNTGIHQLLKRKRNVLVFHSLMANVEDRADVT